MAQITGVNLLNSRFVIPFRNNVINKPQLKSSSFPLLNNLQTDTVCFSGAVNEDKKDEIDVRKLILDNRKRKYGTPSFSDDDIVNIQWSVTDKNRKFLPALLTLNDKALNGEHISQILDYINRKDTHESEFSDVIKKFLSLKEDIPEDVNCSGSALPEYIDNITSQGIKDILTSDVLLTVPKNNFNQFSVAYNNTVRIFNEQLVKYCKAYGLKLNDSIIRTRAQDFMKNQFSNLLLLGMIFDKSAFNELIYNRGLYIKSNYMPRLRTLNKNDLKILRSVQINAITEKENQDGDIVPYDVSLDDKISMLNLLYVNREMINAGYEGVDFNNYFRPVNPNNPSGNFVVDFQGLKIDLLEKVLRRIGLNRETVDKYMTDFRKTFAQEPDLKTHRDKFWDVKYVHLLNAEKGSLLRDVIVSTTSGNFDKFLYEDGPVAEVNKKNRELFEKAGIDYDRWLSPTISPISKKFFDKNGLKEKTFTVKNWNRNPFESLFDGNYTTCCTGLDKNHGDSFLKFLTNTCTTTLEVRTEKNKVIAMSRILMAEIDGRLSMVIENIEVNNKMAKHYLYNDETKYKFREMIFDYARNFAKDINKTDEEIPVYFSSKYYKVKDIEKGLPLGKKYFDVDLIGAFPDKLYINSYGSIRDVDKLKYVDEGDEFALNLSDVSHKTKPTFSTKGNDIILSDSDYNYADLENYNR